MSPAAGEDWGSLELERARLRQVSRNLHYPHRPHGRARHRHEILDVNRRYHDVAADDYDAKWGIDFGAVGQAQVLGKLTQAARPAARARTRARSRSARAPATSRSTSCSAGVVEHATCTDISPGHARDARGQRAPARARGRDRRLRRRRAAVPRRIVRPRPRPRRAAPPARARRARSRSSRACCGPAGRCSSPASPRARATASPPGRSAPPCAPRRSGGGREGAAGVLQRRPPSPDDAEHALESVVDVHAFDPGDLSG